MYAVLNAHVQGFPMWSENNKVELGEHVLNIPRIYVEDSSISPPTISWIPFFSSKDSGFLATIPAEVIAKDVPEYEVYPPWYDRMPSKPRNGAPQIGRVYIEIKEDVPLIVDTLTPTELRWSTTSQVEIDIWNKQGDYADRRIVQDPETGYYRVYSNTKPSNSWYLLKDHPDQVPLTTGYEMALGSCSESEDGGETGNKVSCISDAIVGNIHVQFSLSGQNMKHVLEVRRFIETLVGGWIVK